MVSGCVEAIAIVLGSKSERSGSAGVSCFTHCDCEPGAAPDSVYSEKCPTIDFLGSRVDTPAAKMQVSQRSVLASGLVIGSPF